MPSLPRDCAWWNQPHPIKNRTKSKITCTAILPTFTPKWLSQISKKTLILKALFLFKQTVWRINVSSVLHQAVLVPSSLLHQSLNLESQIELLMTLKATLGEMNSLFTCKKKTKNYLSSQTTSVHVYQYYFHPGKKLTFMWSCHFIRFGRGIFDSVVIFYKECSLMFKEVIHILQKRGTIKKPGFHPLCTEQLQSKFAHFTVAVTGSASAFIV